MHVSSLHPHSTLPHHRFTPPDALIHNSLNDPDTNAFGYTGLSGQPSGQKKAPSSHQQQGAVAPELRLTSDQQIGKTFFDGVDDLLEKERPTSRTAIDDDFFKFREKEALAGTPRPREVERSRRGAADGGGGGAGNGGRGVKSALKVELATQLGVPAASTYDEVCMMCVCVHARVVSPHLFCTRVYTCGVRWAHHPGLQEEG